MNKQHIHKYRRIDIGKRKEPFWVMQCSDPACEYWVPMAAKFRAPRLVGKASKCNRCGDVFLLNRRALKMALPCCEECVKSRSDEKINEFFKKMEGTIQDDAG